MINVTKTYLPPIEEYEKYLKKIWETSWVTNNGPLLLQLENELKKYLGVKHLFFASNGTIVLQIALKALEITKEVITTPFSYVATTNSILWENCIPIFADIEKKSCSIDPQKIEALITPKTQAILATHVYGLPCNLERIEAIAKKHGLKIIYDAAHGFGTQYKDKHLLSFGDISTVSFHATKLFHTIEGGAIITNDDELAKKIRLLRSFGHIHDDYFSIGINGKNSEFHAAMGLCLLPRVPSFIEKRRELVDYYNELLLSTGIAKPVIPANTQYNYSYYPIILNSESQLLKIKSALEADKIFPRRYFYPSLNTLPFLKGNACPVSENISPRILCLPLYFELEKNDIKRIVNILSKNLR